MRKKILMVCIPLFFLIFTFLIVDTFGLFESSHLSSFQIDVAKWQVKINNTEVGANSNSFVVDNFIWDQDENVMAGKVAPGMSGYFDIILNANNTDVSFRFDIDFDFSLLNPNQFHIDYIEDMNSVGLIRTDNSTYSGIIELSNSNSDYRIRVHLSWIDDEINDDADYLIGSTHENTINIPVVVTVTQHFDGETITPYVEPSISE